jgi:hypothetical protein
MEFFFDTSKERVKRHTMTLMLLQQLELQAAPLNQEV